MIVPVRCWTCGRPVAHLWEDFRNRVLAGEHPGHVLDSLGLRRYCCRRTLMGHVEWIDLLLKFEQRQ